MNSYLLMFLNHTSPDMNTMLSLRTEFTRKFVSIFVTFRELLNDCCQKMQELTKCYIYCYILHGYVHLGYRYYYEVTKFQNDLKNISKYNILNKRSSISTLTKNLLN